MTAYGPSALPRAMTRAKPSSRKSASSSRPVRERGMADTARHEQPVAAPRVDPGVFVRVAEGGGEARLDLVVQSMHCAGCIGRIECALKELDGVTFARANLSTKRVSVRWDAAALKASAI